MSDPRMAGASVASDLDPRTGEPRRPWLVWAASALLWLGAGLAIAGLLQGLWVSIHDFPAATWLNRLVTLEPGDPVRVVPVIAAWIIAVAVATVACLVGYYAWAGYGWTRPASLAALAVGLLTLLLNPLAAWCLAPLALAAVALWLDAPRSFFGQWHARRHPRAIVDRRPGRPVVYGPAARYRVAPLDAERVR